MWQERQFRLLGEEIEDILVSLTDSGEFSGLIREPLTESRRGLALEGARDRPWPLLPLIVCEAISGRYEHAIPAAAALQLFMAAGDVFDDIEDADSARSLSARYGPAIATNVATALLILAEKAIARLKTTGIPDETITRVIELVNSYYLTACIGQHLDISLVKERSVSDEIYLDIIGLKSASQIECACHVGALLATNNNNLIDNFKKFGYNLGMAAQITNDIQGVIKGNDILTRKITLPLIFALAQTSGTDREQLMLAYSTPNKAVEYSGLIKDLLFRTGAINYTAIKLEFYKQMALDALSQIESEGAKLERLKLFLQ